MKKSWSDHNAQTNSSLVSISSSVVSNSSSSTLPSRRWLLVSGPGFLASSMMASTSSILWETYSSAFLTPFSFSSPGLISFTWAFRVHACFSISWIVIRCEYHKQTSITNYILKLLIKKKKIEFFDLCRVGYEYSWEEMVAFFRNSDVVRNGVLSTEYSLGK